MQRFNYPIVRSTLNKETTKTMVIQVNIMHMCMQIINEFKSFGAFVIGLAIVSFYLNIKSTNEIKSFDIDLCETIESILTNLKNNDCAIVYTIGDGDEAVTTAIGTSGSNNNGDDITRAAKKNHKQLI